MLDRSIHYSIITQIFVMNQSFFTLAKSSRISKNEDYANFTCLIADDMTQSHKTILP